MLSHCASGVAPLPVFSVPAMVVGDCSPCVSSGHVLTPALFVIYVSAMTIPSYPEIMRPLLEYLAEANRAVELNDICEALAMRFPEMTKEEFEADRLPSNGQLKFVNRVGWAAFELKTAKLIDSPRRAHYQIEERGRKAKDQDATINPNFLLRYDEYREYREHLKEKAKARAAKNNEQPDQETLDDNPLPESLDPEDFETPDETVEDARDAIEKINSDVEDRIKAATREVDPKRFEGIILELLRAMGFGDGKTLGKVKDDGIDGVIYQDDLGVDKVYFQAKRFTDAKVSSSVVRDFSGALDFEKAYKGILVTTSSFTDSARETAKGMQKNIVLIDGDKLAELMFRHNVGCTEESLVVKTMDEDFFEPERAEEI